MMPDHGGTVVEVAQTDGYAAVAESVNEVYTRMRDAMPVIDYRVPSPYDPNRLWIELTMLADPDEELPRRPYWVRADCIVGLTHISSEHVEKIENEIS